MEKVFENQNFVVKIFGFKILEWTIVSKVSGENIKIEINENLRQKYNN